jgi:hypothetical protein
LITCISLYLIAICRLYSFWPELNMKITNKRIENDKEPTNDHDKDCSVKLTWSSFSKIHKIFIEPSLFLPNINNI